MSELASLSRAPNTSGSHPWAVSVVTPFALRNASGEFGLPWAVMDHNRPSRSQWMLAPKAASVAAGHGHSEFASRMVERWM